MWSTRSSLISILGSLICSIHTLIPSRIWGTEESGPGRAVMITKVLLFANVETVYYISDLSSDMDLAVLQQREQTNKQLLMLGSTGTCIMYMSLTTDLEWIRSVENHGENSQQWVLVEGRCQFSSEDRLIPNDTPNSFMTPIAHTLTAMLESANPAWIK